MAGFQKLGKNIKFSHEDPKRHTVHRNDVFWRILRENTFRVWALENWKDQKTL